jgi:extradiol dioxygenase family protein
VPVPHFGVCLSVADFKALSTKLKAAGVTFLIEPHVRFEGKPGEQWTFFTADPSGNSIEFKAMADPSRLFAKYFVDE